MKRKSRTKKPPSGRERQTRFARFLGIAFCAAGFAAVALGWAGAARKTCVDCQIPYLISGGAAGVALVVFGSALLVMAQIRTEARRFSARLEHMNQSHTLAPDVSATTAGSTNGQSATTSPVEGAVPAPMQTAPDQPGSEPTSWWER
jgi:hypothetical protein